MTNEPAPPRSSSWPSSVDECLSPLRACKHPSPIEIESCLQRERTGLSAALHAGPSTTPAVSAGCTPTSQNARAGVVAAAESTQEEFVADVGTNIGSEVGAEVNTGIGSGSGVELGTQVGAEIDVEASGTWHDRYLWHLNNKQD